MNVLFVSSGTSEIGISPFIKSQGNSLQKKGIKVEYFTITEKGMKGYLKSVGTLKEHLKGKSYDVIHAHYSLCGWVAVLATRKSPVVVSFMGCDVYGDITPRGKRTGYLNIVLSKCLQPWVKAIVAKSKNLEKYVYLKKKVHIIPNGVNFENFKPMDREECRQRLHLPMDKKLVLFLGNPTDPRKNLKLVKDAVTHLNSPDIALIVPYPVRHEQIPLFLNAADVFVLASYLEGSPNVVKEAMACNCPVVSTDAGDAREVLGDTVGCYITPFDAEATAANILKSLNFGKRTTGREDIAHLDERAVADRIIAIYRALVKTK